jgi:DNA-directed RNA polymerase subunit RPC12/RpoP
MEQPKEYVYRHYPCGECGRKLSFTNEQILRKVSITCSCGSKIQLTADAMVKKENLNNKYTTEDNF